QRRSVAKQRVPTPSVGTRRNITSPHDDMTPSLARPANSRRLGRHLFFGVLQHREANDVEQAGVLDAVEEAGGADPRAFAEPAVRPVLSDGGHLHYEDGDVIGLAFFFVEIGADGFTFKGAQQAGFFPGFLQCAFAGGLAWFDPALRNDPAFAVA